MTKSVNVSEAIGHFFKLKDWQMRSLYLGGVMMVAIVVYLVLSFLSLIPIVGWIIACVGFIALPVFFVIFLLYLQGYKIDIAQAVVHDREIDEIAPFANYGRRVAKGFKLAVANFVYQLPVYILYGIGYGLMFVLPFLYPSNSEDSRSFTSNDLLLMVIMLVFFCVFMLAWIVQVLIQYVVYPAQFALFLKEQNIGVVIRPQNVKEFVKNNFSNLLIYAAIQFAMGMVFALAVVVASISIFLCIGLILLPIVLAVGITYMLHLEAHMIGQMAKLNK